MSLEQNFVYSIVFNLFSSGLCKLNVILGFKLNVPCLGHWQIVVTVYCDNFTEVQHFSKGGKRSFFFFFSLASLWPQLTLRFGTFSFNLAFVVLWRLCFWTLETWPANFNNVLFYSPAVETSRRLTWWNVTLQNQGHLNESICSLEGILLKG